MAKSIFVACKLPQGFNPETVLGVPAVGEDAQPVIFAGADQEGSRQYGGYGFTEVDEASYREWAKPKLESKFVPLKNGLVFTAPTLEAAQSEATNRSGLLTGFERLVPKDHGVETDEVAMGKDNAKSKAALAETTRG